MSQLSIFNCRICGSESLTNVIDLGEQYITSRFPKIGDTTTPKTHITLCLCSDCHLLQLRQSTDPSEIYDHEYGYVSGISNTMREHLAEYCQEINKISTLKEGDTVMDIGSNDGTLLHLYPSTLRRIGVDPIGNQFADNYKDLELLPAYFNKANVEAKFGKLNCKMITTVSMFYDLPDPVQFAKDIYDCLDINGIWTCEQIYMPFMLTRNSVDTICYEHLEHYCLKQLKLIADKSNFKIVHVGFNECNGGSFRVFFAKRESTTYSENKLLIDTIIETEDAKKLDKPQTYMDFFDDCKNQAQKLNSLINTINTNGEQVYMYGASTKGNSLLQFAGIGPDKIPFAVERNPNKVGKMTSTGIPIISEETMRKNPPKFLLVLPWHFADEIVDREEVFLDGGGQLIFPFPTIKVYSKRRKVLITGSTGFIGTELMKQITGMYSLYGINRNFKSQPGSINFTCDINDAYTMDQIIASVRPDAIVHLAGISSSTYAGDHCLETLIANGMSTAVICDIIERHKLNTRFINASSSEIYKGHKYYIVNDDDTHMFNSHPYAIAKTLGHNVVKYYRENGYHFCNAILFTAESKDKGTNFLLNKVAEHVANNGLEPLRLGTLMSSRDVLHVSDVAQALHFIMRANEPNDYIVSRGANILISDLVEMIYTHFGYKYSSKLIETSHALEEECHIQGRGTRLASLGWAPTVSIKEIIREICEDKKAKADKAKEEEADKEDAEKKAKEEADKKAKEEVKVPKTRGRKKSDKAYKE